MRRYLQGASGIQYTGYTYLSDAVNVVPYQASDSKFCLKLTAAGTGEWHASDLIISLIGGQSGYHETAANSFSVLVAAHRSSNY